MQFIFLYCSIPLFSFIIAIAIIVFFFCHDKIYKLFHKHSNAVPVFEVLMSLAKICPINSSSKWKLTSYEYGCHRCWINDILIPGIGNNMELCGSSIILSSSSVHVGSLIADLSQWPEWNPFYSSQYIAKSFSDKHLKRDHYMEAEQIVSIVRGSNKIQSYTSMYRFHHFYENKVGWILFWHAKKLEFMFFLIQPVRNKNESHQCLLTHIVGADKSFYSSTASLVLQRLRNIQDLISLSSLTFVPLKFSSAQAEVDDSLSDSQPSSAIPHESFFSLSTTRTRKKDIRNTVFILVPFVSRSYWFWKRNVEFKLGVKSMDSIPAKSNIAKVQLEQKQSDSVPQCLLRRTASDNYIKPQILIDLTKCSETQNIPNSISECKNNIYTSGEKNFKNQNQSTDTTSEDSEAKGNSKAIYQVKVKERFPRVKLRSLSETALNNPVLSSHSGQAQHNTECIKNLQKIDENAEDKLLAFDDRDEKKIFNSSVSDFEVIDTPEYSENRIAGFMTQGNYGASELQAEVLLASQIEQSLNSGNFQSSGGWVFHSVYKGMSVLSKSTSRQFLKIASFLCQTELPVSPKVVWKFVKNPQFRFICDETVKLVEVIEKISSSQKLIHTYHEINGIIRKELVDFCLLQTEREELNKYYSCFYSIEYDKCPFMNSVTRGFFRPSGWIVEEINNDPKKSKVTYMIQILINSPDSMFIQELSTLVPQSLHNLKTYITAKPM